MVVKEAIVDVRFIIIYLDKTDAVSVAAVVVVLAKAKECLRKHMCVVVSCEKRKLKQC